MGDYIDSFLSGQTDSLDKPAGGTSPDQLDAQDPLATDQTDEADQNTQADEEVAQGPVTPFQDVAPRFDTSPTAPAKDRIDAFLSGDDNALNAKAVPPAVNPADIHQSIKAFDGVSPDQAARVDELSKSQGMPFDVALSDPKNLEQIDEATKISKSVSQTDENGFPMFPSTARVMGDPVSFAKWRDSVDQLKAIESIIKEHTPPTALDKLKSVGTEATKGFANVFTGIGKGAAEFQSAILPYGLPSEPLTISEVQKANPNMSSEEVQAAVERVNEQTKPVPELPQESRVFQVSKDIEDKLKEKLPSDIRLQDTFLYGTLPQGAGSMGAFMLGGFGAQALKAPAYIFPLVGGALSQGSQAYDEAKAAGASDDTAMRAFLWNLPAGASEAIPLERIFNKAEMVGGESLKKKLFEALKTGGEEALQEMFQQGWGNEVAKQLYDSDRGFFDGVVQSGEAGGILGTLSDLIVGAATGHKVHRMAPKTEKQAAEAKPQVLVPEAQDMVHAHIAASQDEATRINKLDNQVNLLNNLQQNTATTTNVEEAGGGAGVMRDPEGISDFIDQTLKENNQETTVEVDAATVHEVLFSNKETPSEREGAQRKLDQFAADVGVTPAQINDAIRLGHSLPVNTGKLVGKYGSDPIFKAITKQMEEERDTRAGNLQNKQAEFQKTLQEEQARNVEPTQVSAIREQLMKPADEGGAGKTAQEADDDLAILMAPLRNIARQRGETLQETFDRTGLEVHTGEDGKLFVQRVQQAATEPQFQNKEGPAPAFYSQLSKTIEAIPQEKMTVGQLRAALSKGVKPDELKWTGFDELLKKGDGEKLTKAEALEIAQQNAVKVEEVTKEEPKAEPVSTELPEGLFVANEAPDDSGKWYVVNREGAILSAMFTDKADAIKSYNNRRASSAPEDKRKFANYQLPGGQSYRELLFMLPAEKTGPVDTTGWTAKPVEGQGGRMWDVYDEKGAQWGVWSGSSPDEAIKKAAAKIAEQPSKPAFRSSHFNEENILAHVRFNERTDADGNKVLFLEEVQSDWHQKGRKEGYANPPISLEEQKAADKRIDELNDGMSVLAREMDLASFDAEKKKGLKAKYEQLMRERMDLVAKVQNASGVPDAPFKKTWHELVMKRMLRYAAENGFDKVAWTTGEQQAERYDLSKKVDTVTSGHDEDGKYFVDAKKDGVTVVSQMGLSEKELPSIVGKDLAEKIVAKGGDETTFSGVDLKVGGEGMKGFYDKILPDFVNKYAKKWSARVGQTQLDTGYNIRAERAYSGPTLTVEQLKALKDLTASTEMQRNEVIKDIQGGTDFVAAMSKQSDSLAEAAGGKLSDFPKNGAVHSVDITPAMHASVMQEGQPLFQNKNSATPDQKDLDTILARTGLTVVSFQDELGIPIKKLSANQARSLALETSITGSEGIRDFLVALRDKEKRVGDKAFQPSAERILSPRFDPLGQKEDLVAQSVWIDGLAKTKNKLSGIAELLSKNPTAYKEYTEQWRENHPRADENGHLLFAGDVSNPLGAFHSPNGKDIIHLFKNHDVGTFLHEATHFIAKEYEQLVNSGLADAQTVADWETLTKWAGSKNGKLNTEQREKIARGGENYLLEGKAPAPHLIDVFRRFKERLMQIYKSAFELKAEMSDEVREVYARWYASEAEIDKANSFYHLQDTIKNLTGQNVKAEQVEAKVSKKAQAHSEAIKEAKLKTAQLDVDGMPIYRLLNSEKISTAGLAETYGQETVDELTKKFPASFSEEGKSVEQLAVDHGYASPDALIADLRKSLPHDEAVAQRHQQLIEAKEGEILSAHPKDVTQSDEETHTQGTLDALVNDTEAMRVKENKAPSKRTGPNQAQITAKAYTETAKESLDKMPVGQAISYYAFAQAEKRHGADALSYSLKGKIKDALASRMKQLFNHAMVMQSIKLRKEVEKIQAQYFPKKLTAALKRVDQDYVAPIVEILSRYQLSEQIKNDTPYNMADLAELDEDLYALMPDFVQEGQKTGDYKKNLTVEELRQIDDAVQSIFAYGSDALATKIGTSEQTIKDVVATTVGTMSTLTDKKLPQKGSWLTPIYKLRELNAKTALMNFIADAVDGFTLNSKGYVGVANRLFQNLIKAEDQTGREVKRLLETIDPHMKVLEGATKRIRKALGKYIAVEKLGVQLNPEYQKIGEHRWTAEKMIAALLNTGNDDSLGKLQRGNNWSIADIQKISSYFTEKELHAIQGIWDTINTLREPMNDIHRNLYNRDMGNIKAKPVTLVSSEGNQVALEGGYYPMAYDFLIDDKAAQHKEEDAMKRAAVHRKTMPQDKQTKGRVAKVTRPVRLSLDVLMAHLNDSSKYIHYSEIIRDWNRIIKNHDFRDTFEKKFGKEMFRTIEKTIKDLANPDPTIQMHRDIADEIADKVKAVITHKLLGFNLPAAAANMSGAILGAEKIGTKWMFRGYKMLGFPGMVNIFLGRGKQFEAISDISKVISIRENSKIKEMRDQLAKLKPDGKVNKFAKWSFWAFQAFDRAHTIPFWHGAFQKYIETIGDKAKPQAEQIEDAARYADALLLEAQPAGMAAMQSEFQRARTGLYRHFNMFQSFFNTVGNNLTSRTRAAYENKIPKSNLAKYVGALWLTAVVEQGIKDAIKGKAPDWFNTMVINPLQTYLGWFPVVKEVVKTIEPSKKGVKINPKKLLPPILSVPEQSAEKVLDAASTHKQAHKIGVAAWETAQIVSSAYGLPVGNVARLLMQLHDNTEKKEEFKGYK